MKNIATFLAFICLLIACSPEDQGNVAINGSYTTMLTIGDFLYVVNTSQISTYDIDDRKNPILKDQKDVGFNIESLFHHNGLLLIGSSQSMYIFQIDEAGIPQHKSSTNYSFLGIDNCDPIVAKDNTAYVTLSTSSTNACGRQVGVNELQVFDITEVDAPVLLNSISLPNPKGLTYKDNRLFICDNIAGLFIMDITDPASPAFIENITGFSAYDAIVKEDKLIVVGKDKMIQYDISSANEIVKISEISL